MQRARSDYAMSHLLHVSKSYLCGFLQAGAIEESAAVRQAACEGVSVRIDPGMDVDACAWRPDLRLTPGAVWP